MLRVVGFCLGVAVAWGLAVYVVLTAVYGAQAPDWTLAPSFFGGMGIGLWAFWFSSMRWL